MKPTLLAFAAALALTLAGGASASGFAFGFNPRTGDVWVDTRMADINDYGRRYRDPFVDELVRYHGAPRDLVVDLLLDRRWAPGDVYFACALASIIGRPCRYVVDYYEEHHGRGWGAIAKDLGIKPGSAEFHRLKRGFVPTYDRWGRPVTLDPQLRRDFPGRGKGGAKQGGGRRAHAEHGGGPGKAGGGRGNGNGGGQGNGKGGGNGKGNGKG